MPGLIVHEWFESFGGAEKVVLELMQTFPDSGLCMLWDDTDGAHNAVKPQQTWLSRTPLRRHKALALPLMPTTWRHLCAPGTYEWLLVSSHLFAHHARLESDPGLPKYVYAHTPARYIWAPELDRRGQSLAVRLAGKAFKPLDRRRAQNATAIAANSQFVRQRVASAWDRDARVIYPPVDIERLRSSGRWREMLSDKDLSTAESLPKTFVLGVSRFVPYKRLDLVIAAAELADLPVVIAGRGPEELSLRAQAAASKVPVTIVVSPSDALLACLYQEAAALVFPAIEDFGIVPVEAQSVGTPVVTGPVGGQTESIVTGVTGVVADSAERHELARALTEALSLPAFDGYESMSQFGARRFRSEIQEFVAG